MENNSVDKESTSLSDSIMLEKYLVDAVHKECSKSVMEENLCATIVKEESTHPEKIIMEDNKSNSKKQTTSKRKFPPRVSQRKRFTRHKNSRAKGLKAEIRDGYSSSVSDIFSQSVISDEYQNKPVSNESTVEQERTEESVVTVIKEEPLSPTENPTATSKPVFKSTAVASPMFNNISKQIPSPDIQAVTLKPDLDLSHFIDESTDFWETSKQTSSSRVKQTEDFRSNVPAAPVGHVTQPKNIPRKLVVAQFANTPLDQSENIPTSSRTPSLSHVAITGMMNSFSNQQSIESTDQLLETVGKVLVDSIPPPWITVLKPNGVALCLLSRSDIVTIQRSLLFEASGKVTVAVHGKELPPDNPFWQYVKTVELQKDRVKDFIDNVKYLRVKFCGMEVCKAVEEFEPFWKTATDCEVDLNRFHDFRFRKCCRSRSCDLVVPGLRYKRCSECTKVYNLLSRRALVDSKKPSVHRPFKCLTSPEKRERFEMAVKEIKRLKAANRRLREKLNRLNEDPADSLVDSMLSHDAEMAEHSDR